MRTIKELAAEALLVQDASNLKGIVAGFHRALCDLDVALLERAGAGCNIVSLRQHPIVRLWISKINDMTFGDSTSLDDYHDATVECERLAKGE